MNALRLSIAVGALAFGGLLFAQTAAPPTDAGSTAQPPSAVSATQGAAGRNWGPCEGRGPGQAEMMHRPHARRAHRDGFMRYLDANRDGRLARDEVLAAQKQQLERFDRADADHDGVLSREEIHAARVAMREEFRKRRSESRGDAEARRPAAAPTPVLPPAERGL